MEAFKNLLKQLEIQKAEQRHREAEEATKQNELRKAQADLSLDEAIALYSTQLEASTKSADLPAGHRRVIINKAAGRTLKATKLEGAE